MKTFERLITGAALVPFALSVGDLCNMRGWVICFISISAFLVIVGIIMSFKKIVPFGTSLAFTFIGLFMGAVVFYNTSSQKEAENIYNTWTISREGLDDIPSPWTSMNKYESYKEDALAMYIEANNYLKGENGCYIDYQQAKEYAVKAAAKHNPGGNAVLATMYINGMGCAPDTSSAIDNIIIAVKGGYEQGHALLNNILKSGYQLSAKERVIIEECVSNSAFLDSIEFTIEDLWRNNPNTYYRTSSELIDGNMARLESLSSSGYFRATELLYFNKQAQSDTDKLSLKRYADLLNEYDRVPDLPWDRMFFYGYVFGKDKCGKDSLLNLSSDEERLAKWIPIDYYPSLCVRGEFLDFRDFYNQYEYVLAQFKRTKYLVLYKNSLKKGFYSLDGNADFVSYYEYALKCLQMSTSAIAQEMKARPFYLSNNSAE